MRALLGLLVAAALLLPATSATAAPLNLILECSPDITSGFIDVEYDAATDQFNANGFSLSIDDDCAGPPVNFSTIGNFSITATIDSTGAATSGTLSITGEVLGFGPNLLTGTLAAFGYPDPPGGDIFEFLFTVTGGDLAIPGYYGSPGDVPVGVILTASGSGFNGSFLASFNNNGGNPGFGIGVSDTAPIPEPMTLVLLAVGALCCRRRSSPS